jgi:IS1 family transposase
LRSRFSSRIHRSVFTVMRCGLLLVIKGKKGRQEEATKGTFWRITALDGENRLRLGRALAKIEAEAAYQVMNHIYKCLPQEPSVRATDGFDVYQETILKTWGKVPEYCGRGKPPTLPQPGKNWKYLHIIKKRDGSKRIGVSSKIVYGDAKEVKDLLGEQTVYVERTHLTSRQMNGRIVRTTRSFSQERRFLEAARALEDALSTCTRPVRTRHGEGEHPTTQARWRPRTPAMAAGLTDHVWTVRELLTVVLVPRCANNL